MKSRYFYILVLAALAITGCTKDSDVLDEGTNVPVTGGHGDAQEDPEEEIIGVHATVPELVSVNISNGDVATRSSLAFDYVTSKMKFSWGATDASANMGVFPVPVPMPSQQVSTEVLPINFFRAPGQDASSLSCQFVPQDGNSVQPLQGNTTYIAFRPFTNQGDFDYTKKELSYEGQSNGNNVLMGAYYKKPNEEALARYNASEVSAASHLGEYDYLVSPQQTTRAMGGVEFQLERMGLVVRFFIKNPAADPENKVFEELQIVTQNTNQFTLRGDINLGTRVITPTKKSNVMVLKYGDGLEMGAKTEGNENYDYYNYKYTPYIVSYMMMAPVNLTQKIDSEKEIKINLYLVSHTKGDPSEKQYYKSNDLSQPNLTRNMLYQWKPANLTADDPIEFSEITVQEWQEATAVDNGDGSGTQGW